MEIKKAVEAAVRVAHPDEPGLHGIYGTIFTAPAQHADAHLRNVTIFADAEVDRSPCGTGTSARLANLHARGRLRPGEPFVHESVIGTVFEGRVAGTTRVGPFAAVIPEIRGRAWLSGVNELVLRDDDPFPGGFRL